MIGYTFIPDPEQQLRWFLSRRAGRLPPPASEAIRLLSLRLPNVLSGDPIAPDALLKPRLGGAGQDGLLLAGPTARIVSG